MQEDRDRAFESGCDGFITKPFDVDDLLKQVAAILANSQR